MDVPTLPQNKPLSEVDSEIENLIHEERKRQIGGLELIASENFTSTAVLQALGSCLTNKYAEGLPGKRYYGGTEVVDKVEELCMKRALEAFHVDPAQWGVNVQPYSGSVANLAAFMGVMQPGDAFLGLALASGGHLTHGHKTETKSVSSSSIFYKSFQYGVTHEGYIDYDQVQKLANDNQPKLIVCGASAYPRDWDYKRFREIADSVGAVLMCDMAHIAGLVAAQEASDPFKYCDIVTTTTHKSLRGPRSGMIFYRRGAKRDIDGNPVAGNYNFEAEVNFAVFPGCQGGPHMHQIAAVAVALKEAASPEFKAYVQQLKKNCATLASSLQELGSKVVTGGSDNHLLLWDVRPFSLTGSKVEKACDFVGITVNKNMIAGDKSAVTPGGVRLGTPALTSRGFGEAEFKQIAALLHRIALACVEIQKKVGVKLVDFVAALPEYEELKNIKKDVEELSNKFGLPGF